MPFWKNYGEYIVLVTVGLLAIVVSSVAIKDNKTSNSKEIPNNNNNFYWVVVAIAIFILINAFIKFIFYYNELNWERYGKFFYEFIISILLVIVSSLAMKEKKFPVSLGSISTMIAVVSVLYVIIDFTRTRLKYKTFKLE